jgi:drug/metabolite transporter (DMT)-like permease
VTYVAIALAFPIFFIRKKLRPEIFAERVELAKVEGKKTNFSPFLVLINAFSDIIATNLQGIALNFIPASAFQMMRGGTVASTFIFSIILLKMKPEKYQIIGVLLTIVGVLIVGTSSLISSSSSSTKNTDAV